MAMDKAKTANGEMEIDLLKFAKSLVKYIWLIVLVAMLGGGGTFAFLKATTVPKYESWTLMYINSSVSVGSVFQISSSSISASRSLVSTYEVILKSRSTLESVIEKEGLIGKDGEKMEYEELYDMVAADSENDTEIIRITVTDTDPERSMQIANAISEILPDKISDIIEGTEPALVDAAVTGERLSSGILKKAVLGAFLGAAVVVGVLLLQFVFDQKIYTEQDLMEKYDLPLLAVIPDLRHSHTKKYGKYGKYGNKYAYGYGEKSSQNANSAEKTGNKKEA